MKKKLLNIYFKNFLAKSNPIYHENYHTNFTNIVYNGFPKSDESKSPKKTFNLRRKDALIENNTEEAELKRDTIDLDKILGLK